MGEGPLPEHPVKHHDELIVYAWDKMDIKTSQNFARQAPVAPPSFDPSLWVGVYDFSARMPSAEPICYDKRF